jgi:hypothetical protein
MKAKLLWLAFAAVIIVVGFAAQPWFTTKEPESEDPRQNIQWLAAGTPEKQVDKAHDRLVAAGAAAFPELINHLENETPADERFQRAVVSVQPDGSHIPYKPTIGGVCFDILVMQIEGRWPKGLRHYSVVTPQWLRAHAKTSLAELRNIAFGEALRSAKAAGDTPATNSLEALRNEMHRGVSQSDPGE